MDIRAHDNLILDGTKIGLYRDRVEAWKRGERIAPVTVDMALTRACNLRCVYCYGQLQENERKVIGPEVIDRTFRDFAEIGVRGVSLVSDGESTCSPHLPYALDRASFNGLAVALGTNGVLLDRETLRRLPALSYLRFNISAAERFRYNEIMRPKDVMAFEKVVLNIYTAVEMKRKFDLPVTIGMQMVLMPEFEDQILPLARLAVDLEVDYLVIKHCSDDEHGSLGVDYSKYKELEDRLIEAEALSTITTRIVVKWSKLRDGNVRSYQRCYGPPFHIQISGSGLVAPCGMFFAEGYKDYHIGNIVDTSFRELWEGSRYWEVMQRIASPDFDARTMCGCLCLQHSTNRALDEYLRTGQLPGVLPGTLHKEFL